MFPRLDSGNLRGRPSARDHGWSGCLCKVKLTYGFDAASGSLTKSITPSALAPTTSITRESFGPLPTAEGLAGRSRLLSPMNTRFVACMLQEEQENKRYTGVHPSFVWMRHNVDNFHEAIACFHSSKACIVRTDSSFR